MSKYNPTVILWLRRTRSTKQIRHLQEKIAGLTGVEAALFSDRTPQLVLITYDQKQTSSQTLLRVARDQDQGARLIGI